MFSNQWPWSWVIRSAMLLVGGEPKQIGETMRSDVRQAAESVGETVEGLAVGLSRLVVILAVVAGVFLYLHFRK